MTLTAAQVRRFARHIALPEVGIDGQVRICEARAALVGTGLAVSTAADYLAAAGVGELRRVEDPPADARGWLRALEGANIAVRAGFDDDPMLRVAVRLGVPAVFMRGADSVVDVIAFRRHGPCPHAALDIPPRRSETVSDRGLEAVVAGTLAATEALLILVAPGTAPRARHLRLPLDGGEPQTQEFPWAPECFLCGGEGREASFS